jgi:cob(I)alamin adenosyltransferase
MSTEPFSDDAQTTPHFSRQGDDGRTTLGQVGEVDKHDLRLSAYGDCEEANAAIGTALSLAGGGSMEIVDVLASVQHDLFDLASDLRPDAYPDTSSDVHITSAHIERVERAIDHFGTDLHRVRGFVLPGGTPAASLIFQARTVVRRAERSLWAAVAADPEGLAPLPAQYMNRLSALLFVLARATNSEHGDTMWKPMASVTPPADQPMETVQA